jgi:tetratricopeptide (TPR) repeat protein
MVVRPLIPLIVLLVSAVGSLRAQQPETLSLLGRPLIAPRLSDDTRRKLEAELEAARQAYDKNPGDPDAVIWLGRRTAYLGRFGEAIEVYTRGIEAHLDEPRLYRHRGHRYITIRKFDLAIRDLQKAAELVEGKPDQIEPDGQPNDRNVPTSTLQTNIYYHLGLAQYLKGEFANARDAFRRCLELSKNPDMLVATSNWLYMALQRLGRKDEAQEVLRPVSAGLDVIENQAYHRLLLFYKGEVSRTTLTAKGSEGVTLAYGLANDDYYSGLQDRAKVEFKEIVDKHGNEWPAFGYIAAEAELARIKNTERKKHKAK